MKLNIGAGTKPKKGYINLDQVSFPGIQIVHDMAVFPWPFKDNTFDLIEGDQVLEHLPNLLKVMEELYRISKPGAVLKFVVPYHTAGNAYGDFTHVNFFNIRSIYVFDTGNPQTSIHPWQNIGRYRFKLKYVKLHFHPFWLKPIEWLVKIMPGFYDYHLCYIFRPSDLEFWLEVIKDE